MGPENLLWLMYFPLHQQDDFDVLLTRKPKIPDLLNPPNEPTPVWQSILPPPPNPHFALAGGAAPAPPTPPEIPFYPKIRKLRLPLMKSYKVTLKSFPRLTHLAVPFAYSTQDTQALDTWLEHPTLEVLVIVIIEHLTSEAEVRRISEWVEGAQRRNISVKVGLALVSSDDMVTAWETEVRGGTSIWSVVED